MTAAVSIGSPALPANPGERLAALRALLAEKFPAEERKSSGVLATGVEAFDSTEGGLRRGSLTEVAGSTGAGAMFIETVLAALVREKCFGALVDAGRSFDPQGSRGPALQRLLWVLCDSITQAVKATDLLLRDGNLALVLLDLQMLPLRESRRIPASTWHRFQRVVEQTSTAFVVLTPRPMVEGARVRIAIPPQWNLTAMRQRRRKLMTALQAQVFALRNAECGMRNGKNHASEHAADLSAIG